jgi:calcium/calmodulin-dependent protein kinase I
MFPPSTKLTKWSTVLCPKRERFHLHYDLRSLIQRGSFAKVVHGRRKSDNSDWAVKIVKREGLSAEDEQSLLSEVAIMEKLHHPNIIRIKEFFDCPRHMYIVMELLNGEQLYQRVVQKGRYTEPEARIAFRQIISAISHLHGLGIVHRDIKLENIMSVNSHAFQTHPPFPTFPSSPLSFPLHRYCTPTEGSPLKITDFGFAQQLKPSELLHNACGTPMYIAPDMLRRDHSGYGKEVDLWSAGVVLFIMISGYPPFFHEDQVKLLSAIQSGEYEFPATHWDGVTALCKDLIEKLLVVDPSSRLSSSQTEFHPWMIESLPSLDLRQSSDITEGTGTVSRAFSFIRSRLIPHSRSDSMGG